ncbi:MAG: metallophosphoesterase family protein [Pseudobacteriovorax sp.]|nr:metallophosphoesterase family protein [Pseudobacteriovorax sp.]
MLRYLMVGAMGLACGPKTVVEGYQLRVIWDVNPHSEATILWTVESKENYTSLLVSKDDLFESVIEIDQINIFFEQYNNSKLFQVNENPSVAYTRLENLEPGTEYYLKILGAQKESEVFYFRTAPTDGIKKILIGGDSRSDRPNRITINQTIKEYRANNPEVIAFSHGGDYIDDGSDWRQWSHWLNDWSHTTLNGQILPIIPTRGNHEIDEILFNQVFGKPGDETNYYLTQIGILDLFTLNSEISVLGDQYTWLQNSLEEASKVEGRFRVVNYHRPAKPAVKQPASTKYWIPLFEKFDVRVALESDGHVYKRTAPIFGDSFNEDNGVIYLGEGGLGVKQRSPKNHRWFLQGGGMSFPMDHFIAAEIGDDYLHFSSMDKNGEIFDEFTISPR